VGLLKEVELTWKNHFEIRHWGIKKEVGGYMTCSLGKWVVRWMNLAQFWGGEFWYEFF
jgi:hypothetical protein